MKEIEITRTLELDRSQAVALDTHSFLNILNVLNLELAELADSSGCEQELADSIQRIFDICEDMSDPDRAYRRISALEQDIARIELQIETLIGSKPELRESTELCEALDNLASIFSVMRKRVLDMEQRIGKLTHWQELDITQLVEDFQHVLSAIEKNSKGRFRIIPNIAARESRDYYIDLKIHSSHGCLIRMPLVLVDVTRDLLANARKYTPPGGRINAGIWGDEQKLCISVEDSGCGIPENELESVIDYGCRGSNVLARRTMGGGLGLTKAYFVCKQLGGRFWIRSELGCGTHIRMVIPTPPR